MNQKKRRLQLLGCLVGLVAITAVFSLSSDSGTSQAADLTKQQQKLNLESFEKVWKTIKENHWDPKLGGLDWQAIYKEFRPKVEKSTSQAEFRKVLKSMLGRLKQSHFGIIPGEVYDDVAAIKGKAKGLGVPGFDVRVIDGKALVVSVEKNQPAMRAGVKTGWEIVQIRNEKIAPLIQKVAATFKGEPRLDRELAAAVLRKLRGDHGEKLKVVFRDGKNKTVAKNITLIRPKGVAFTIGDLPTLHVDYEAKTLGNDVAYFRLNTFADPIRVMPALQKTVEDNLNAKGFIIDLRGNPGGIGGMAIGFGNWFISKANQKLGTMHTRTGDFNFVLNPRVNTYEGPLAILVDGLSASTSEILAGGLQDLDRAKIFGSRTMGAALPSLIVRLPNKDGFQYAIANYLSVGGKALEGNGVEPDVAVEITRDALLAGNDPALDAALDWIRKENTQPK